MELLAESTKNNYSHHDVSWAYPASGCIIHGVEWKNFGKLKKKYYLDSISWSSTARCPLFQSTIDFRDS